MIGAVGGFLSPARRRRFVVALGAFHLLIFVVTATRPGWGYDTTSQLTDAGLFERLAVALRSPGGAPHVSYPPLAIGLIRIIGGAGLHTTMLRLLMLNALADLTIVVVLTRAWSKHAAVWYLALSAPLLAFLVNGFDTIVAAIVITGVACIRRDRARSGALLLTVAVFMKLWPVLLVGVLWAVGYRRAARWLCAFGALGLGMWIAATGFRGPVDVVTYRGSKGWHVESLPGVILGLARGEKSRYEQGSWRVGSPPPILGTLTTLIVVLSLVWLWRRVHRDRAFREPAIGMVSVASIATMLLGATLLSPQYLAWLFPFLAIAIVEERDAVPRLGIATAAGAEPERGAAPKRPLRSAAIAMTVINAMYVAANDLNNPDGMAVRIEALIRNVSIVLVVVACVRASYCAAQARATSATTSVYGSPLTSITTSSMVPVNANGAS